MKSFLQFIEDKQSDIQNITDTIVSIIQPDMPDSSAEDILAINTNVLSADVKNKILNLGVIKSSEHYDDIADRIKNGMTIQDLVNVSSGNLDSGNRNYVSDSRADSTSFSDEE